MLHRLTKFKWLSIGLASLVFLLGCKTTRAPQGYLAAPEEMNTNPFGGWADVYLQDPAKLKVRSDSLPQPMQDPKIFNHKLPVSGELIAVEPDTLYLQTDSSLAVVPKFLVDEIDLQGYDSGYSYYAGHTFFGVLSTLSHGFLLVFSAPLWILFGTGMAGAQAKKPILEFPDDEWLMLRTYARFPQGIPEGMTIAELDSIITPRAHEASELPSNNALLNY